MRSPTQGCMHVRDFECSGFGRRSEKNESCRSWVLGTPGACTPGCGWNAHQGSTCICVCDCCLAPHSPLCTALKTQRGAALSSCMPARHAFTTPVATADTHPSPMCGMTVHHLLPCLARRLVPVRLIVVCCVSSRHADTCLCVCVRSNASPPPFPPPHTHLIYFFIFFGASQVVDRKGSSLGNADGEVVLKFETHMYKVSHLDESRMHRRCACRALHAAGGKASLAVNAHTQMWSSCLTRGVRGRSGSCQQGDTLVFTTL